ncbi:hypothetical protein [Chamaesiphon sp.]|uniref:hypothetical protein n=1 Tax=Chamaesiphon sp. TaxID=2814140 RepID=UPI0035937230
MLKRATKFISWLLFSLLLFIGVVGGLFNPSPIAICFVFWSIIFFPPLLGKTRKFGWKWNVFGRLIIFILSPVLFLSLSHKDTITRVPIKEQVPISIVKTSPSSMVTALPIAKNNQPKVASPNIKAQLKSMPKKEITGNQISGNEKEFIDPQELVIGKNYTLLEKKPLMPEISPIDVEKAIEQIKYIPSGGSFLVLSIFDKNGNPWYEVSAFNQDKELIGTGWINSIALMDQSFKETNNK